MCMYVHVDVHISYSFGGVRMSVCICMFTYIRIHDTVCIHIIYIYICIFVFMYVSMHVMDIRAQRDTSLLNLHVFV